MQNVSLAFLLCRGLAKNYQEQQEIRKKHNKIVMLARSKLNSIESQISEALMHNQISHEDFMTIINEERNYRKLKQKIRTMRDQKDKK